MQETFMKSHARLLFSFCVALVLVSILSPARVSAQMKYASDASAAQPTLQLIVGFGDNSLGASIDYRQQRRSSFHGSPFSHHVHKSKPIRAVRYRRVAVELQASRRIAARRAEADYHQRSFL